MLIIAMNRTVIIHDQRHIHVIMNIIVNPRHAAKTDRLDPSFGVFVFVTVYTALELTQQ